MRSALEHARGRILKPNGLDERDLERALGTLMGASLDYGDLYFQLSRHESWGLEDGIVKDGHHGIRQGVGVRANAGERTGFAHTEDTALPALLGAARAARAIARAGASDGVGLVPVTADAPYYGQRDPLASLSVDRKIELLQRTDAEARRVDGRVKQVNVNLSASHDTVLVLNSAGAISADVRPLVRMRVSVIAEAKGRREQGVCGGGGRQALDHFIEADRAMDFAREAARQALDSLDAVPAPAGTMTVVLGPGWPGVLLHEAIGHGLEGDFNRKGTSAFSGRIGERVASEQCTIVDDGTLALRRGTLNIDDEGAPTGRTVLIENGILKGYMHDRLSARLMGAAITGNGRRESYAHLPMPRMTNTFMLAGRYSAEEIIGSVDSGLYAANFAGGQVDITSGRFVFTASEAYLIEAGRLTHRVKGATLIGNGPDVLTRVSMVGDDLTLDPGIGTCGKAGQSVPVCVGQPTVRVDGLTVGGTEH